MEPHRSANEPEPTPIYDHVVDELGPSSPSPEQSEPADEEQRVGAHRADTSH